MRATVDKQLRWESEQPTQNATRHISGHFGDTSFHAINCTDIGRMW